MIIEAVEIYAGTLNPNSKFYNEDLQNFKRGISAKSEEEIKLHIDRLIQFSNPKSQFNLSADKEVRKMDKGGMYDVNRLKPINALD